MSKRNFYQNLDSHLGNEFNVQEAVKLVSYDTNVFWSWAARNLINLSDKGLLFKVSGYLHKGFVLVTYNTCPDLYTVTLLNGQYNEKKKVTHVYCDELQTTIDNLVEKQAEYKEVIKPTFG